MPSMHFTVYFPEYEALKVPPLECGFGSTPCAVVDVRLTRDAPLPSAQATRVISERPTQVATSMRLFICTRSLRFRHSFSLHLRVREYRRFTRDAKLKGSEVADYRVVGSSPTSGEEKNRRKTKILRGFCFFGKPLVPRLCSLTEPIAASAHLRAVRRRGPIALRPSSRNGPPCGPRSVFI